MNAPRVASPCIKVCTLDPSGRVCLGCLRTPEEIADWARYGDARRAQVVAALTERHRLLAGAKAPFEPKACARCGNAFGCGAGAGDTDCWCARYPRVDPVAGRTCLCPACLAAAAN